MEEHQFTEEGIKNIQVYSSWVVRGTRVVYTYMYLPVTRGTHVSHNTPPLPCKIKKIK